MNLFISLFKFEFISYDIFKDFPQFEKEKDGESVCSITHGSA